MKNVKEFSVSSNGDRWSLEMHNGEITVVHAANEPSGGYETRTALAAFLQEHAGEPEHAALLQVLGQCKDQVEDQLQSGDTDTPSHRIAKEYLRLGGRRQVKVDDNIVSTRSWEDDPADAETFWQTHVAPLDQKEQRDIAIHLPSLSEQ